MDTLNFPRYCAALLNKWPNGPVILVTQIAAKRIALQRGLEMARQKEIISDIDSSENFETQESVRENNRKAKHRGMETKFRVMRTKAMLFAAIRLWELKNRIDD